jgi:hypothetical protein
VLRPRRGLNLRVGAAGYGCRETSRFAGKNQTDPLPNAWPSVVLAGPFKTEVEAAIAACEVRKTHASCWVGRANGLPFNPES